MIFSLILIRRAAGEILFFRVVFFIQLTKCAKRLENGEIPFVKPVEILEGIMYNEFGEKNRAVAARNKRRRSNAE